MNLKPLIPALAACGLILGGCANLDNKTPLEMMRHANKNFWEQDNRFNFDGEIRGRIVSTAPVSAEQTALNQKELNAVYQTCLDGDHKPETCQSLKSDLDKSIPDWADYLSRHSTLAFSGAVDLPAGKLELVPQYRYENRTSILAAKVPMLLSLKETALYLDGSAAAPFASWFGPSVVKSADLDSKLIRFKLDKELTDTIPIHSLAAALPKAIDETYAQMDPGIFSREPMDAEGRKLGAQYRIRMDLKNGTSSRFTRLLIKNLSQELQALKSKNLDPNISSKTYDAFALILDMLNDHNDTEFAWLDETMLQKILAALPDVRDPETQTRIEAARVLVANEKAKESNIWDAKVTGWSDTYLSGSGRILGTIQEATSPLDEDSHQNLVISLRATTSNFGHPVFSVNPGADNVMDYKQLYGNKDTETDAQESDRNADAAAHDATAAAVAAAKAEGVLAQQAAEAAANEASVTVSAPDPRYAPAPR